MEELAPNYSLFNNSFISVNKKLLSIVKDGMAALLMGELIYYDKLNSIEDGWIPISVNKLEKELYLTRNKQDSILKKIKELNFIDLKIMGQPPVRHFKLNSEVVYSILKQPAPRKKIVPFISLSKEDFYIDLNKGINDKIGKWETLSFLGNISKNIGIVLCAWSLIYYKKYNKYWNWQSETYGILSNYVKRAYGTNGMFNFNSFLKYFNSENKEPTIKNFLLVVKDYEISYMLDKMDFKTFVREVNSW